MAYWKHAALGKRLKQCTMLVLSVGGKTAQENFWFTRRPQIQVMHDPFFPGSTARTDFQASIGTIFRGRPDASSMELLQMPSSNG
jgi:uncharacterized protein (DUF1810 family)